MARYNKILFDLDGTLIDSSEGVTKCVQYALESIGIHVEDRNSLITFIGPPLDVSFPRDFHTDKETTEKLIKKYRERYNPIGVYECRMYDGVTEILKSLHDKGYVIGLASSKPENMCEKILEHLDIIKYFDYVVGASEGPERRDKIAVLREAMKRMDCKSSELVLIGDTRFDVEGANEAEMPCIGITFGFGTREELESKGAVAVFDTFNEVEAYLEEA